MSEESAPKLRLKPKLGSDAEAAPSAAGSTPATPAVEVPAPADAVAEAPAFRLKPRLSTPPMAVEPAPVVAEPPADLPAAAPAVPDDVKPTVRFSLRPKAGPAEPTGPEAATAPPDDRPASTEAAPAFEAPAPLEAPPVEAKSEPFKIAAIALPSNTPFPEPGSTQFPPPPGFQSSLSEAEKAVGTFAPKPVRQSRKKLFVLAGVGLTVLVLAGGAAFFLLRAEEPPPPPPRRPKPVAKPVVKPAPPAPTTPVAAKPAESAPAVVGKKALPAVVTPPAPPPKPVVSPAFKAWVDNVKILGIRSGSAVRIFIGGTSYAPGDLVNPQLGILFDSYDPETRMVRFRDQTGATAEQRN